MRQVGDAELIWIIRYALGRAGRQLRIDLASRQSDVRRRAEQMLATDIAQALDRLEILSSAPLPENTDLFSAAAYGAATGVVRIDDD